MVSSCIVLGHCRASIVTGNFTRASYQPFLFVQKTYAEDPSWCAPLSSGMDWATGYNSADIFPCLRPFTAFHVLWSYVRGLSSHLSMNLFPRLKVRSISRCVLEKPSRFAMLRSN